MTKPVPAATGIPEAEKARARELMARGFSSEPATLDTWQDAPHNRWTFAHVDEFVPTVTIRRDRSHVSGPLDLPSSLPPVADLESRLRDSWTDALLIVRSGDVIGSWFSEGFRPHDRHLLMSVSKSVCGILVGALADDGVLDLRRTVSSYIPQLAGGAFGDATVQQVIDMTVAVDYDEEYTDLLSHVRAHDRVAGWRTRLDGDAADSYEFLRGLRGEGPAEGAFQYCSANTDVLAWLVEVTTGARFHEALSERVWSRLGCDDDASITVDASGFAFANGGISCTARDLGRVGTLMLNDGMGPHGRVVSAEWVRETMAGGDQHAARGSAFQAIHPLGSYKNHWWSTGNARRNVYAVGIHGQYVWLDAQTSTAIIKFSSAPEPLGKTMNLDHAQLFTELCEALH